MTSSQAIPASAPPDDVGEVVVAEVDPADADQRAEDDRHGQRDASAPSAARDRPDDQRDREVEDDRVHRVAAREAVVGQDVRPGELRPGPLEEQLHQPVEQQGAAARDRQEQRGTEAALQPQDDDRDREEHGDHEDRSDGRGAVHHEVEPRARQVVEDRRGDRVEQEHLVVADALGDRAEHEEAGDEQAEAGNEEDRGPLGGRSDLRRERPLAGGIGRKTRLWAVRRRAGVLVTVLRHRGHGGAVGKPAGDAASARGRGRPVVSAAGSGSSWRSDRLVAHASPCVSRP